MKYIMTYESWFGDDRFEVGDIITCVRPNNYAYLSIGDVCVVTSVNGDLITIDNGDDSFNRTRFRLATPEEIEKFKFEKDITKYNL